MDVPVPGVDQTCTEPSTDSILLRTDWRNPSLSTLVSRSEKPLPPSMIMIVTSSPAP